MSVMSKFKNDVFLQHLFGWWFGVGAALLGIPLFLSENSSTVEAYLDAHHWIFYVCLAPMVLLSIVFVVACLLAILQVVFETYHEQRSSGASSEQSMMHAVIIGVFFLVIIGLGFCFR